MKYLYEKETSEITADLNSSYGSQIKWYICWYGENNTASPEFIQAKILFKNEVKIKIFSNKVWMPVDNQEILKSLRLKEVKARNHRKTKNLGNNKSVDTYYKYWIPK